MCGWRDHTSSKQQRHSKRMQQAPISQDSSIALLLGAVQIVPVCDTKDITVALVVPYPVQLLGLGGAAATLKASVDDVGGPT